jgi:magnesium transporter
MAFLSEILGRPVVDPDGVQVGVLHDVVAAKATEIAHPLVKAVVIREDGNQTVVPFSDVLTLLSPAILLSVRKAELHQYTPADQDIYLAQDVLDKQIIDTDDVRVVRVNDIELVRVNGSVYASNVDVGAMGILRRIGLSRIAQKVMKLFNRQLPKYFISWDDVELISQGRFVRLRVPRSKLSDLHPADLANIIGDINRDQTPQFLESLPLEDLADTLEQVEEDLQVSLVENMSDEKVADVLEEMSPDEAADLLAELPPERSKKLIGLMENEDAEGVRKLLTFPEDSAGGLMTTEYVSIQPGLTAEQVIQQLRETASEAETIFYVYVVDEGNHLKGVFSLSDLILAKPDTMVDGFMHKRLVSVHLLDEQNQIAQLIARYNLLAIPVVDDANVLHGIVTSDDALDRIIPTVWKKRLPRYYR